MAESKVIKFIEDTVGEHDKAFLNAHKLARHWYESNKDFIELTSGIYDVLEDTSDNFKDTEEYRKDIVLGYTGEPKYQNPQTCKHQHTHEVILPEPTCQDKGLKTTICDDCNLTLGTEVMDIVDHDYVWTANNDATCTNDATETGVCKWDNHIVTRIIPNSALGHDYPDEWIIDVAATCGIPGSKHKECARCGKRITEEIEKLEHTWTSNENGTHTCTTDGGCHKTENCYPTTPGVPCEKCGYVTNPLKILTDSLPTNIYNNAAYPSTKLEANISDNVKWSISNGSLPDGLSLSEDGVLNGNPTVAGTYSFTVKAEYKDQTDSKLFSITINKSTCQVTFNKNWDGDTSGNKVIIVDYGNPIGTLPNCTRENYTFLGWFTTADGGIQINEIYKVTTDITLYAHWTKVICTITFDLDRGVCNETTRKVGKGELIGTLPEPTKEGYLFVGWYTASTGGLKIDEKFTINANATFYARYAKQGQDVSDITFGDATTEFNISVNGDRTNFNNDPYTLYGRIHDGSDRTATLVFQTGFSSGDMTNKITSTNKKVILYLKVTNNGESGEFDIGFDCDSYIVGDDDDRVLITRIEGGVRLGKRTQMSVTVPYTNTAWIGKYSERTAHRYVDFPVGSKTDAIDTGYCLTMNNIHINKGSYTILEVTFQIP